ncbi:MAG: hypothetical protein ATN35_03540 [Epulopiscium sp. Nele67-Bin004]|nr:MAG: hypothetical protein ATN35_03540 [Epulopiscium sp. Nele67-Bin004]
MTERRLLKGLAKGNVKYYEKLVDTYSKYVTVVVQNVGRTLSTQDIEELVADVFIKIWNNRDKLDIREECLKGYLAVMARNITLNKLKTAGKIRQVELEENEVYGENDNSLESKILQSEMQQTVLELIEQLPDPDNEIFIRRYLYFESLNEISENMNIPLGTVGTKIARSKTKLKKGLLERGVCYE